MMQFKRRSSRVTAFQLPEWVRKTLKDKNLSVTNLAENYYLVVEGEAPNERARFMDPKEFAREFEALPEPARRAENPGM